MNETGDWGDVSKRTDDPRYVVDGGLSLQLINLLKVPG